MSARNESLDELRVKLAFGSPVREGVELVRAQGRGAIVVLGCGSCHESMFGNGVVTDQPVTSEVILRATSGDGALVVNADWSRVVRTHTRLEPDPTPSSAGGTRHATAERFAAQSGHPVIVVSEEQRAITLFIGGRGHRLRERVELRGEIDDRMNLVRTLGTNRDTSDHDTVTTTLRELSGLLDELGESGRTLRTECQILMSRVDKAWPGTDLTPAAPVIKGVSNQMAGFAQTVVQAGTITSLILPSPAPTQPTPRQLPFTVRELVNQAVALRRLTEMADADIPEVHCVVGTPGVGKTAVVVHWATVHEDRFPDGVLFAELRGYHPTARTAEPDEVIDGFLSALGMSALVTGNSLQSRVALYRSVMHDRRMLVVLDDAKDAEQVRLLLPSGRNAVVVTSRTRLRGLVSREGAKVIDLDPLPSHEAMILLGQEADPDVADLARLCGHLPLALRIARQRLASGEYADVAAFIAELRADNALNLFDDEDPAAALRPVFIASYRHLTD